jgi:hypothetical protein
MIILFTICNKKKINHELTVMVVDFRVLQVLFDHLMILEK